MFAGDVAATAAVRLDMPRARRSSVLVATLVATLVALLTACDFDLTGPARPLAGTYTMTAVSGRGY
jgi:outer membrane lipopolysaccharide assembly protein LptE/RlpB